MSEYEEARAKQREVGIKLLTAVGSEKRLLLAQAKKIAALVQELA